MRSGLSHSQLLMAAAPGVSYDAETLAWETAIGGLGGSITLTEKNWADDLINAIQAKSYNADILVLYPFLATNIAGCRVPLRDSIGAGALANSGWVDADCSHAGGLDNTARSAKFLSTGLLPQNINSGAFGMGIYLMSATMDGTGTYVEPMGCYDSTAGGGVRGVIDLRTGLRGFRMGANANSATQAVAGSSGHWYGERASSTLRELYKDGSSLVSNTTSDAGFNGSNARALHVGSVMIHDGTRFQFQSKFGYAYICKPLGAANQADFHTLLNTYLITPTGR